MARTGRPTTIIDKSQFEKLCALQCTLLEICDFLGITDKTLNSWCRRTYGKTFSEVFNKKRTLGMISLRRAQFELAKKNPAMAIFLGKNLLGQTDNPISEESSPSGIKPEMGTYWKQVDDYFTSNQTDQ